MPTGDEAGNGNIWQAFAADGDAGGDRRFGDGNIVGGVEQDGGLRKGNNAAGGTFEEADRACGHEKKPFG
jgi:hypothetical protein